MTTLGNLIWLVFGGIVGAVLWLFAGVLLSITIIGIPFGIQCFKISRLVFWPFGKKIEHESDMKLSSLIGNVLWIVFCGWELCLLHLFVGVLFGITIIGIPFAKQHFKFAKLAILPFGATIK